MQRMHIFRRDRTMQLIKCIPWNTWTLPPPHYNHENEYLPRGRRKKCVPYLSPLVVNTGSLNQTQTLRSGRTMLQRKRAAPSKRFRPSTAPKPGKAATQPPATASKVPEAPENRSPPLEKAQVCKSTPWPGTGRMSGNLFEDRNWLLPPNYLNNDCRNAARPKSPHKRRT